MIVQLRLVANLERKNSVNTPAHVGNGGIEPHPREPVAGPARQVFDFAGDVLWGRRTMQRWQTLRDGPIVVLTLRSRHKPTEKVNWMKDGF